MIIETILSSIDQGGKENFAPVGVHVSDEVKDLSDAKEFELFIYPGSQTFDNLKIIPQGVINFTDDSLDFVETALFSKSLPTVSSCLVLPPRITCTKTVWEFEVISFDDSVIPARIKGKIVWNEALGIFMGFCRAQASILEATILATRLQWIKPDEVTQSWPIWQEVVTRTGGKREKEAFAKLTEYFLENGFLVECSKEKRNARDRGGFTMKKILVHLESDSQASVFDQITAYDAGVDQVLAYGGVKLEDVTNLVYGTMFTRGGDGLRNTAIFIGGTHVPTAEEIFKKVRDTFFGDVRVSVMFDANGSNTTAAALVHKIAGGRDLKGKKALVLAGTGPVGIRTAILLAKEGCQVYLSSRQLSRAQNVGEHILKNHDIKVIPVEIAHKGDISEQLEKGISIVACCGAPGVQMLSEKIWSNASALEIMADINAVNPLGVEGIKVTDNGKERNGKLIYGAIAIGNLKMKVHRACVQGLFEKNNLIMDFDSIYAVAKKME